MPRPVAMPIANDKRRRPERTEAIRILKPAISNIPKSISATVADLYKRNATRKVSQLSAVLLHQEQAGEIAKTQLLCVRMSQPRLEQKPWQPLSKLGGCSFARFLNAVEKLMHQRPNPIHFFFQREMARVEKMELCTGDISFVEFSTLHRKDSIVFAPSDQHGGLLFAEILLPIGKDIQIPFCVVED